jgi:hypothetical protein
MIFNSCGTTSDSTKTFGGLKTNSNSNSDSNSDSKSNSNKKTNKTNKAKSQRVYPHQVREKIEMSTNEKSSNLYGKESRLRSCLAAQAK